MCISHAKPATDVLKTKQNILANAGEEYTGEILQCNANGTSIVSEFTANLVMC